MTIIRRLHWAVAVALMATACQAADDRGSSGAVPTTVSSSDGETMEATDEPTTNPAATAVSGLEEVVEPESGDPVLDPSNLALPPARGIDELAAADANVEPEPTSITIDRLELDDTRVLSVGVEANGDMTVPPPTEVGWYRYGPMPGESGSAVLAGHIASGGVPGAFRHLDRLEPGDVVTVGFHDGSTRSFVVEESIQVDKTLLPFDTVFARSGPAKLALITCGGEFDDNARSYRDNLVVIAAPLSG